MIMVKIGIEEVHERCLNIAKKFDEICTKHKIPYYMLGGTMLGAVRHRGFIPWDDDMDFGVPRRYYVRLIKILCQELPLGLKCRTFEDCNEIIYGFAKIEDTSTVIDDIRSSSHLKDKLGINIDIFPLDFIDCPDNSSITKVYRALNVVSSIYIYSTKPTFFKSLIKNVVRLFVPKDSRWIIRRIETMIEKLPSGTYCSNIYGRWGRREAIPVDWYGENCRYKFEDFEFIGLKEYDKYLTQLYGDYMKLPPKENQEAHVDNVYLR